MKVTDALRGEHGVFYAQFDHLEQRFAGGFLDNAEILAALLAAALEPHASIEDEVLFAALESALGGEVGPIPVMRMEHQTIEELLAKARQAAEPGQAASLLIEALQVAREHFAKEEHVLFPMAEQMLDRGVLESLGEEWAARRGVRL